MIQVEYIFFAVHIAHANRPTSICSTSIFSSLAAIKLCS